MNAPDRSVCISLCKKEKKRKKRKDYHFCSSCASSPQIALVGSPSPSFPLSQKELGSTQMESIGSKAKGGSLEERQRERQRETES